MEVQAFNFDSTVVGFNFQVRADAFWVIALSSATFITPWRVYNKFTHPAEV